MPRDSKMYRLFIFSLFIGTRGLEVARDGFFSHRRVEIPAMTTSWQNSIFFDTPLFNSLYNYMKNRKWGNHNKISIAYSSCKIALSRIIEKCNKKIYRLWSIHGRWSIIFFVRKERLCRRNSKNVKSNIIYILM